MPTATTDGQTKGRTDGRTEEMFVGVFANHHDQKKDHKRIVPHYIQLFT
jgi:hypothetical protein